MNLKKAALRWCKEPIEAWDPVTETWTQDYFRGRVDLMDRFLSNFNKPTRRRMLFAAHDAPFPPSLIIRHPGTKDVYIIGAKRQDARAGNPYVGMTILQLCTDEPGTSSGYAELHRRVALGPANDPGWLVDTVIGKTFVDTEFRTSSDQEEAHDLKIENLLFYIPRTIELKAWDYIHFHGGKYRVIDSFPDSGFSSGRIDEQEDTRVNFKLIVKGNESYDDETGRWLKDDVTYNVTGVVLRDEKFALWASQSQDYVTVYIDEKNIGVVPEPNLMSLVADGVTRVIRQVSTQAGTAQWELRCE